MSIEEHRLDELLGAYALDAVDDDERRAVEEYLRVSPAAAAEVREHSEVASMLAWSAAPAPAGLWEKIVGSIDDESPAPPVDLARVIPLSRRRRTSTALLWVGSVAAAAALAVVAVRAIDGGSEPSPLAAAYDEAAGDRESVKATLSSADNAAQAEAVVDARGHGYIDASTLPVLPQGETYQLWGVFGDRVISLGVLGRNPDIEPFSVDGELTTLVITREVDGGVVSNGNPEGAYVGELS
jgi:anti-sigma factor RsiW